MKKELILIDASWVIHRMWHVHQDLQVTLHNGTVLKSGHLYGVARLLKSLNTKHPDADLIFCLDGVAVHGTSLNPEYKANRSHGTVTTAFNDLGVLAECAATFDRTQVSFHRALEADEVIAYLVQLWQSEYERIIIYSADGDMLQLLAKGDNIFIAREFNRNGRLKLVDLQTYYEDPKYTDKFLGCRIDALPMYRAMVGDSSDNLPGFPRIRKKVAKEIAEKYSTVDDVAAGCKAGDELFPKNFGGFLETLCTNYKIMRLPTVTDLALRGHLPNLYSKDGDDEARCLFSLYRIRSVSPVETVVVDADSESKYLKVRDIANENWRHPNSALKG